MNKKNLHKLEESIIQAGQILRGERKPSREFIYKVEEGDFNSEQKIWAVCVDTDDEQLLIRLKLYQIEVDADSDYVFVRDEKGEATFAPREFFFPLLVPQQLEQQLAKVA